MLKITQPPAQKWPWKIINFWSVPGQVKFLIRHLKISHTDTHLTVNTALENLESGIIFLPDNLTQVILAMPLIKYLNSRSSRTQISIFCYPGQKSLIHGFFPKIPIFEFKEDSFFLGNPHFKDICTVVKNIKPDFTILLERTPSLLTLFLQVISSPKIRIGLEENDFYPFFNFLIKSSDKSNIPVTYMRIADLWKSRLIHSFGDLIKIGTNPDYSRGLRKILDKAGLSNKKIILFIWDQNQQYRDAQLDILSNIQLAAAAESCKKWSVLMASSGNINAELRINNVPIKIPYLQNLSLSNMIGLFSEVDLITGMSTPMLYLAVYLHPIVRCFYRQLPHKYDVSSIHSNFKAAQINENQEEFKKNIQNMLRDIDAVNQR